LALGYGIRILGCQQLPLTQWQPTQLLIACIITVFPSSFLYVRITTIVALMSFVLRRPFAVASAFKQFNKPSAVIRAFHSSPLKSSPPSHFNPKPAGPVSSNILKSNSIFKNAFKRNYMQESYPVQAPSGNLTQRLIYGGALVGGAILATNFIFNRETREDGGMPPYEREYLNQTFLHTGLGVGIIALAARTLHTSGWSYKLMARSPWLVIGVGLAASIGTMYGTFYTHPNK
jgi:growth hormone-inducible transmembrane protein